MRLFVTVNNKPAILVGYAPGKDAPMGIVIGIAPYPMAVDLKDCILPKMSRKLRRKIQKWTKEETQAAQRSLAVEGRLDA